MFDYVESSPAVLARMSCPACQHFWYCSETGKVDVQYFRKFDVIAGEYIVSNRPGTLEAIERVGGEPLPDTAHEVDINELDGDRFQKRQTPEQPTE
jgi:hypothetical protein